MKLMVQSDASYLSRSHSRSVIGGIWYRGKIDGAIHSTSAILDVVVASVAEAEQGGVFRMRRLWLKSDQHRKLWGILKRLRILCGIIRVQLA